MSDGMYSSQDSVCIYATTDYEEVAYNVVDSEYSSVLDAMVMVSSSPENALKIYHVETGITDSISLSYTPVGLSISPDGLSAAVGYDGGDYDCTTDNYVSLVDLSTPSLTSTITLDSTLDASNDISDIVLTNDHIITVPMTGQWNNARMISLDTGNEQSLGFSDNDIYAEGFIKRHAEGYLLYFHEYFTTIAFECWEEGDSSLSLLEEISNSFGGGKVGNLWFYEGEDKLITDNGIIYILDYSGSTQLSYSYDMELGGIKACDISSDVNELICIREDSDYDDSLNIYNTETDALDRIIDLPTFLSDGADVMGHGQFVYYKSDGTKIVAIEKTDEDDEADEVYALVVY